MSAALIEAFAATPAQRRSSARRAARARVALSAVLAASALLASAAATAASFVFAGEENGIDVIAHPTGYDGVTSSLSVSVCIDPASANAAEMVPAVQSTIATWNALVATTSNLALGGGNGVPSGTIDFESVLLHELGHCIGLAHPNAATESGLATALNELTKATDGADNTFATGTGVDGLPGSSDDQRGDDVNLNWFEAGSNDPFQINTSIVDSTTYSRELVDLPGGHSFAANAERAVGAALSVPDTECVMQQGTISDEAQRSLGHEDVAGIRYAMSGLDEIAGTSDDYTYTLSYGGLATGCDIDIDFDAAETGFAVCITSGGFIPDPGPGPPGSTDHVEITHGEIYFNPYFVWFFAGVCGNDVIEAGESCDDGNATAGDGCDASCNIETGFTCSMEPSLCTSICGDGLVRGSEACDDGGTLPGDGCDASCGLETGYQCSGEPSSCAIECGDGIILGGESCDDGGTAPGDGCDATCAIESGYSCSGAPSSCDGICGDGLVRGSETCDDGGTSAGDGCDALCSIEVGYGCVGEPSSCSATCGDGLILGGEGCDDGGVAPGDGCDALCAVEPGYTCGGEPSSCSPASVPALSGRARALWMLAMLSAAGLALQAGTRRRGLG